MNETKISIKNWAATDRPREKLLTQGATSLSDAELIAILLGTGSREDSAIDLARKILASSDNNLKSLAIRSIADLKKIKGIGEAKAVTIAAAMELGRRRQSTESIQKNKIKTSADAASIFNHLMYARQEEFWLACLNTKSEIIDISRIHIGGINLTLVDTRLLFAKALEKHAVSIMVAHNHPSGNLTPSKADEMITQKIAEAGKLLEIKLLDHIIISSEGYYSFMDNGLI